MQLTPRYDGPPVLRVEVPFADVSVPLLRQRRRLAAFLTDLETEHWTVASRCSEWSIQDVVAHLVDTDRFWALSITSGFAGTPTRFLAGFDPAVTPELLVAPTRARTPAAVLEDFVTNLEQLADVLKGLDGTAWSLVAEAPPGHLAVGAVVLHALWDGWVHERDVVLPLGLSPVEEADEVTACLVYVAALGPTLLAAGGSDRLGTLGIEADRPTIRFVVDAGPTVVVREAVAGDAGAPWLSGQAVDLVEGLSFRAPLRHHLPASDRWLLGGLAEVFDHGVEPET